MKVSLKTVRQFTDINMPVDELVTKINQQLGSVDETHNIGAQYKDALIVKVVSCAKHENADKLNVCKIDDGGVREDVERDTDGLIQVVCGAPNVHADMFAVWLPPQSIVPSTFGDSAPFTLGARELRGVMSQGMLAAGDELAINSDHNGIVELTENDLKDSTARLTPGMSFAQTFGLDDYVIDVENKMFTHRPDLFGQLGVAREIAGIQGEQFKIPDWYDTGSVSAPQVAGETLALEVFNDAETNVPRFMTITMSNVTIAPSPLWLQCELVALGGKPINNVVDLTNYVMLLTAQPTHAYDYDKIRGHKIGARMATKGETIRLLNDKTYELNNSDIVIADGDGPIGLAGIMGGGDSEVTNETKNLVVEVANFDMYTLRRSSMHHGVFTDALTRFNKGQSPYQNDVVLAQLVKMLSDITGGMVAGEISDLWNITSSIDSDGIHMVNPVSVTSEFINARLGTTLSNEEITQILKNVGMKTELSDSGIEVYAPFWRTDLELPEDIVEEVGRLYGFDRLPRELPRRNIVPAGLSKQLEIERGIRQKLAANGLNEVLTYSFVHDRTLRRAEQNPEHAFKLSNALSPDLQYYRLSLTPSLLDKMHMNHKAGYEQFGLFEIGRSHFLGEMDKAEPSVPNEDSHIAMVVSHSGKSAAQSAAFYTAKRYAEQIASFNGYKLVPLTAFDLESDEWGTQLCGPYEPSRSLVAVKDEQIWGVIGEFKSSVVRNFKLPRFSAGFELHTDAVDMNPTSYKPLSRYPETNQDITLRIAADKTYAEISSIVHAVLNSVQNDSFDVSCTPIAIYKAADANETSYTFRIRMVSHKQTLSDAEAGTVLNRIAEHAKSELNAIRV